MGRRSGRKGRTRQTRPNIPAISLLRPRLDALLGREELAGWSRGHIRSELDAAFEGLNIEEAMPVLVRAYHQASEAVRKRLDETVPGWLAERGYTASLLSLLARGGIHAEGRPKVLAWLEAAGIEGAALQEIKREQPSFHRAYAHDDGSQGTVIVLWYADWRRQRVRGMGFLIDHNPPWEGAVKDILMLPKRTPEQVAELLGERWPARRVPLHEVEAAEAKKRILQGLEANRREGIRLPRDLIAERDAFLGHVLTLPDEPYTPRFTAQDFDNLAHTGQPAEGLSLIERRLGRRVRLEDGTEVVVLGAPPDLEDWV